MLLKNISLFPRHTLLSCNEISRHLQQQPPPPVSHL